MSEGHDEGILPELLGYHLRRAQLAVFADFARSMTGIDLTPGQFGVLARIAANPGLSQSALGRAVGIERSSVVAVIDRLDMHGLPASERADLQFLRQQLRQWREDGTEFESRAIIVAKRGGVHSRGRALSPIRRVTEGASAT